MNRKGFTLVEILIVVIILGILAAIVIPQFTQASNDARESALTSDLQTVRSQLELYKVQHGDEYPLQIANTGTGGQDLINQLTTRTDNMGTLEPAGTNDPTTYPYGPYLQQFPTNDFATSGLGQTVTVGTGTATPPGDDSSGWFYNSTTGQFWANDSTTHAAL